jgi:CRP-like cAMP-binding protein
MKQLITLIERELTKHQIETSYTQLKKGDFFLYSGQVSRHIAYVKTGFMRTYHLNERGDEITTDFCQPGQFCVSYYSFYMEQPAFEYIEAITDCELQLIDYPFLQKLYHQSLEMNMLGRKLLEQAAVERDLRMKKIMHQTAKEKYEWFAENYSEVYKVAKLQHIASFLGINVEALSRVKRTVIT